MPTHMPSTELLADYASGAASPGTSLLIACHLTQAPESRRHVAEMERIGGALLADEEPAPMQPGSLDTVMAMLDDVAEPAPERAAPEPSPLPQPLIDAIGVPFSEIQWRFRLPGVSEYMLDGFDGERVSILRARPGTAVPQHTHKGAELTLVMAGALLDGDNLYQAGDVAMNDEEDDHRPRIIGDEICYCLTVLDGDLQFTGTFSRALNFLGE